MITPCLEQVSPRELAGGQAEAWLKQAGPEWFRSCLAPDGAAQAAHLAARCQALARAEGCQVLRLVWGETQLALMGYERQAWDCAHFGFECAKIAPLCLPASLDADTCRQVLRLCLGRAVELAAAKGVRLLTRRILSGRIEEVRVLEKLGFYMADNVVTLCRPLDASDRIPADDTFRPARPGDLSALQEIAANAFPHSRFLTDPAYGAHKGAEVYVRWLEGVVGQSVGQPDPARWKTLVLVADGPGGPKGFVALRFEGPDETRLGYALAEILLVAVHPASRQTGLGRALLSQAAAACLTRGAALLEATTWINAKAPLAYYQRFGFRVVENMLSFNRLCGDTP